MRCRSPATFRERILAVFKPGVRLIRRDLARLADMNYWEVDVILKGLLTEGLIVQVGTWEQFCLEVGRDLGGTRRDAGVYACAGTPMLSPLEDDDLMPARRPRRRSRGSGVIAPPPYATGFRWGLRSRQRPARR